jgi:hypothetical protein
LYCIEKKFNSKIYLNRGAVYQESYTSGCLLSLFSNPDQHGWTLLLLTGVQQPIDHPWSGAEVEIIFYRLGTVHFAQKMAAKTWGY